MDIETLADAWTHGATITVYCAWGKRDGMKTIRECQFSHRLDLMTMLCTRGPNFPVARLREMLMCPRCKSRRVRVFVSLPAGAASNSARVAI